MNLTPLVGESIEVEAETFVPLVIDEVFGARFNQLRLVDEPTDIPKHIFPLSKAFTIVTPEPPGDD
ncbi:hypothetical protein QSH18_16960 [Xanthomonas sp. NCPPB 2654]|uniref:hypothetical protein n=1 Tax=unclassified Xanthomonas TaxID=2643310 RepID=UPI0021E0F999|nr:MULTISPECIES: hypothetical protein [unclassified Xanthomonas]MDL5367301.1 hypothetical protein [Xanthomonas sp. NCPPB 2654]UYC19577.1 hypothetical protein NUG20_15520 [Xanthomonas sp. CFBP 8443]